jgi:hypothetical protein
VPLPQVGAGVALLAPSLHHTLRRCGFVRWIGETQKTPITSEGIDEALPLSMKAFDQNQFDEARPSARLDEIGKPIVIFMG